jgi:hypothetical protein
MNGTGKAMCVKNRCGKAGFQYCGYAPEVSPHYSRRLLLQPPIPRYDKPDGGWARRLVGQHTVSSMPPFLAAPRVRLAWRLGGFVKNPRE